MLILVLRNPSGMADPLWFVEYPLHAKIVLESLLAWSYVCALNIPKNPTEVKLRELNIFPKVTQRMRIKTETGKVAGGGLGPGPSFASDMD